MTRVKVGIEEGLRDRWQRIWTQIQKLKITNLTWWTKTRPPHMMDYFELLNSEKSLNTTFKKIFLPRSWETFFSKRNKTTDFQRLVIYNSLLVNSSVCIVKFFRASYVSWEPCPENPEKKNSFFFKLQTTVKTVGRKTTYNTANDHRSLIQLEL